MDAQPLLPTLERHWPALIPGPVFVEFELRGPPGHKGRHRARIVYPKGGNAFIHMYADPATEAYEKTLAGAAALFMRGKQPTANPVALLVHAYRPIPESWSVIDKEKALQGAIRPTSRPDGDNYLKAVQDALNKVVWADDSQVVDARVIKRYDPSPCMRIEVREFVDENT